MSSSTKLVGDLRKLLTDTKSTMPVELLVTDQETGLAMHGHFDFHVVELRGGNSVLKLCASADWVAVDG